MIGEDGSGWPHVFELALLVYLMGIATFLSCAQGHNVFDRLSCAQGHNVFEREDTGGARVAPSVRETRERGDSLSAEEMAEEDGAAAALVNGGSGGGERRSLYCE